MRTTPLRRIAPMAVLLLVVAACGDSGGDTTTTAPGTVPATGAPATTAAPPTTAPPTTNPPTPTTAPPTTMAPTTTAAPTTTVAVIEDAQAVVDAKVNAVLAVLPEGWTGMLEPDPTEGGDDTDIIFGPCAGPDAFDLDQLDEMSAGIAQVDIEAPAGSGVGVFPDQTAQVEARVFVSEQVAIEAFAVLETVLGTADGRECLAAVLLDELGSELPEGSEVTFAVDELVVPGADVGTRISASIAAGGITADFFIDVVAARMGACTVYSSFQAFGEPFDPDIQTRLFNGALI